MKPVNGVYLFGGRERGMPPSGEPREGGRTRTASHTMPVSGITQDKIRERVTCSQHPNTIEGLMGVL
jgi:hypothetical protein